MPESIDLKYTVEDILSSYEARIENISSIFEVSQSLINDLPESLFDNKEERGKINTQLRDLLAKNGHLRRKDFDNMMCGVLSFQEEREKEAKSLLKEYFKEEKAIAQALRKSLKEFKDALARDEAEKVKEVQTNIKEILAKQNSRKREVTSKLKEFQKEQAEIPRQLRELLAKGEDLRIKDFKLMLNKIRRERLERLALQKKRKEGVIKMLQDFKKQRRKPAFSPLPPPKVNPCLAGRQASQAEKVVDIDAGECTKSITQNK